MFWPSTTFHRFRNVCRPFPTAYRATCFVYFSQITLGLKGRRYHDVVAVNENATEQFRALCGKELQEMVPWGKGSWKHFTESQGDYFQGHWYHNPVNKVCLFFSDVVRIYLFDHTSYVPRTIQVECTCSSTDYLATFVALWFIDLRSTQHEIVEGAL